MKIDLHIDRLVVEGSHGLDRERLAEAVRAKLSRRLGGEPASPVRRAGAGLGELEGRIATAVHGAVTPRLPGRGGGEL